MKAKRLFSSVLAVGMLFGMLIIGASAVMSYTDVSATRWSADDIAYVTEKGYMDGVGGGKFNPAGTMERGMIVTVLYRMEGKPYVEFSNVFKDVRRGEYFADAVIWANENGITTGVTKSTFEPHSPLTREQMATFFSRYAEYKLLNTDLGTDITGYSDYKTISKYAVAPFSWAKRYGIINGDTSTTLSPKKTAKREEFAAILHRFDTTDFTTDDYRLHYSEPTVHSEYTEKDYPLVDDADFYVAVDGNDNADGTFEHPFATFARAQEAVRTLKATADSEIKVAFKAGNYGALDNLTFTSEDSGTEDVPITYCAYGDGDVIFSNGIIIPESAFVPIEESDKYLFTEDNYSSIMKVDLSGKIDSLNDSNVLFSETGICHEARYPNKDTDGTDRCFINCTTTHDPYASIELQYMLPKVVEKFRTVEGMKVTGYLRTGWLIDTFHVKSYDPETRILTFDFENYEVHDTYPLTEEGQGGYTLMYEGRADDTVFFSNLSDQLDANGEYWYDPNTKYLYVYNPTGEYSIGISGTFLTLKTGAEHISFVGLEFNTATDSGIYVYADNITFDLCTFGNISGNFVMSLASVTPANICNITVKNSEFYNFVCAGIKLNGRVEYSLKPSNIVIENNYFHDFALPQYWGNEAVQINDGQGVLIAHNVFKNGAHGAISYSGVDITIEYNIFDSLMKTTQDFGAVYTFRLVTFRSNAIRYNLFCNIEAKGGAYGVYLDGASGQEVYGNLFYNAGDHAVTLNGGRDNEVYDNIIINNRHSGDFLMYNSGLYEAIVNGTNSPGSDFLNRLSYKPAVGSEWYEMWYGRWPQIYNYTFDAADVGDINCVFTTINYIKNNTAIGSAIISENMREMYDMFGDTENNIESSLDANPYFEDPTHGDYRIREDADFFKIPLEQIGRY